MEEKGTESTATPPKIGTNTDAPLSRRRGGGQKRKLTSLNSSGGGSSNPQTTSSKRQAREKPQSVPLPLIYMNGPCTRARLQPNISSSSSSFSQTEAPVKSEAEVREWTEEIESEVKNWEAKIEAEYEAIRTRDANVHVVPVHAGWFSWTKIHPLEEKMLPSFFSGKSDNRTREMYMEIRNWIIKKFHFNPGALIELKHLSELSVGELDARQEVLEFLDYWGLINYHPFPQNEPAAMSVDAGANPDANGTGKKDSLVDKLFQIETVESWSPLNPGTNTAMLAKSPGLFPESVIADELVKSEGPAVDYHCNSCSADCSRKRYHCQKQADFDLCAECFNNGKFGSNMSPTDFILMDLAETGGVSGGNWTDQETLLLLEAIEIFTDNWSEIAEHVATKTKAQCILRFVQMPIEDAFFNPDNEHNTVAKETGLPVTITTEDSASKVAIDIDTTVRDIPERNESAGGVIDNQGSSSPMEISKQDDTNELDKSLETLDVRESFALKSLKEAFEAVGVLHTPGGQLSFAEAGNPVMTLAAFLARLVEPNIATASVRSLLKSLSADQSSEQLAARNCFQLEDPPDDKKTAAHSEGAATETIAHEAQNHDDEHVEKHKKGTADSVVDISQRDDDNGKNKDAPEEHKEKKDSAFESQKPVGSPRREPADKVHTVKEADGMATHEEAQPASVSESNSDIPKEHTPKDAEESLVPASHAEIQSNSVKESDDKASALKDETSKSEKKESELLMVSNSVVEREENTGHPKAKECGSEKKEDIATRNDHDLDKLKRAAVTALSAAAVKAKLLADHEEEQIRQLATLLVEKQLHKLESKLDFFNYMESVMMLGKEQLEKTKQRLFHERAHIIATRFGMSASARPTSQSVPPNRATVAYPNLALRPSMGMNSLRPPVSKPVMAPTPTSSTYLSAGAGGSSIQHNADNLPA